MTGYYVCVYGLGGSLLDPIGGMAAISQKCQAMGLVGQLTPYDYTDTSMVSWIKGLPPNDPLFLIGDSCGANRLPWIAEAVYPRKVTAIYPIQASVYCNAGCPDIPDNVENALIGDPVAGRARPADRIEVLHDLQPPVPSPQDGTASILVGGIPS